VIGTPATTAKPFALTRRSLPGDGATLALVLLPEPLNLLLGLRRPTWDLYLPTIRQHCNVSAASRFFVK